MNTALVMLLIALFSSPCIAQKIQKMSDTEYKDYMKKLDAAVAKWDQQLTDMKVEDLRVTYADGKVLDDIKEQARQGIRHIRGHITLQQTGKPTVGSDLAIFSSLNIVNGAIVNLLISVPDKNDQSRWESKLLPSLQDLHSFELPIMGHLYAETDELQERADACTNGTHEQPSKK